MILLLLAIVLVSAFPVWLRHLRQERWVRQRASQFRASLQNIVHAMRAGAGFLHALEYVVKDCPEPLSSEWQRALQAVRLGAPLVDALDEFARRVPLAETAALASVLRITQNTGGSLSDVLETLAMTLQDKETLREKVAALTAQGKASGILLSCLPFAMLLALSFVAPEMASPFFTTLTGQVVLVAITISLCIGGLVIKKIVTIHV